jgi:5-methylcytosine-specific restriction protein A
MPTAPLSLRALVTRPEKRENSHHRKVYKTQAWLRFRAMRLAEQPTCQACERAGRWSLATEVHHTVKLADGGPAYSRDTTECMCKSCHSAETRAGR